VEGLGLVEAQTVKCTDLIGMGVLLSGPRSAVPKLSVGGVAGS
jgi:hypothetical protein